MSISSESLLTLVNQRPIMPIMTTNKTVLATEAKLFNRWNETRKLRNQGAKTEAEVAKAEKEWMTYREENGMD